MLRAKCGVTGTGTPHLALNIGGTTVQANYASGSGTSSLVFTYTILAGQTDTDGISINANALSLNGGTISDAAGNTAVLTTAVFGVDANLRVDPPAPTPPTALSYDISSHILSGTAEIGSTVQA